MVGCVCVCERVPARTRVHNLPWQSKLVHCFCSNSTWKSINVNTRQSPAKRKHANPSRTRSTLNGDAGFNGDPGAVRRQWAAFRICHVSVNFGTDGKFGTVHPPGPAPRILSSAARAGLLRSLPDAFFPSLSLARGHALASKATRNFEIEQPWVWRNSGKVNQGLSLL